MKCSDCKFWFGDVKGSEGECRFYAPQPRHTFAIAVGDNCYADWPRTLAEDWCGQARAKEPVKVPELPMQQSVSPAAPRVAPVKRTPRTPKKQ